MLIDAIHILCGSKISFDEFQNAKKLLTLFVHKFEDLYGESNMVFNVHLLKHLPDCVRSIGPLHTYSNYSFEDHIGHLVRLQHGTTDVASQVSEKYLMEKNMYNYGHQSTIFREFYDEISSKKKFSICRKIAGHAMIRKANKQSTLTVEDKNIILNSVNLPSNYDIEEYDAMLLDGKVYYEINSNSKKKTYDSLLYNLDNKQFGEIDAIISIDENVYILINEKFEVSNEENFTCKSNICLKEIDSIIKKLLSPNLVGPKFAMVKFDNIITCSKFPNMCERN